MDWIIVLLIIVGVVSRAGKKKKQQAQKQARQRQAGFDEAARLQQGGASRLAETLKDVGTELKAELQDELEKGLMDDLPLPVQRLAGQVAQKKGEAGQPAAKLPYTKEEWQKLFASPAAAQAGPIAAPARAPANDKPMMASVIAGTDAGSDTGSVEGESPLEHAAHKQRIAAEEERIHREHAQLRELRSANLQKLRSAVVMSEVLGRPVSLRPRGRR